MIETTMKICLYIFKNQIIDEQEEVFDQRPRRTSVMRLRRLRRGGGDSLGEGPLGYSKYAR